MSKAQKKFLFQKRMENFIVLLVQISIVFYGFGNIVVRKKLLIHLFFLVLPVFGKQYLLYMLLEIYFFIFIRHYMKY